ncbi:DNA recombination protein RmuC [Neptunomonas qingdaonensis]|uniref:DNA recombination protein RmuC n=1 Tax=Neptunomonas qingdaonensis TaxID=1045558 RepID=A0A1I2STV4_9GAMM|nr:DNA recombination protein RmuC [Neptunomonas qingdaonensis]
MEFVAGWDMATSLITFIVVAAMAMLFSQWTRSSWGRLRGELETQLHQQQLKEVQYQERLSYLDKLENKLDNLEFDRSDLREQLAIRQAQVAELEARLHADRESAEEKLTLLAEARDQLKQEFQNLANQIFDEKSQRFSESSRKEMGMLLTPLRDQIGDFKRRVEDVYDREAKDRRALHTEISQLKRLNVQMSQDAINLTQALKGESKTQGNWGEIVLERVLEESGLRKGHEYEVQVSLKDQQQRYQPDVIVHLPDGKDVIIDSKVSLTAYEQYCSSDDAQFRLQQRKAHAVSLQNHIRGLGDKAYQKLEGVRSLDFVLMFVPIEGAFLLALEHDPELFRFAFERNIMLVSPTTLLVTLRTIQNIWRYEHQSQNAQEIAKRGADLYDKFVGFIESLEDVGKHLSRAQQAYDVSFSRLSSGRGNLVQQAVALNELGVSGKKILPKRLVDIAEEADSDHIKSD